MALVSATTAKQHWGQTLASSRREPVTITEHGRETAVLMDVQLARRALQALEDAQDAVAAAAAESAIATGEEETIPLADVAAELGISLD